VRQRTRTPIRTPETVVTQAKTPNLAELLISRSREPRASPLTVRAEHLMPPKVRRQIQLEETRNAEGLTDEEDAGSSVSARPSIVETEQDVGSSVSHAKETTTQLVFWKQKLTEANSIAEVSKLATNAAKTSKGTDCPFCNIKVTTKFNLQRHLKVHCTVLNATKMRLKYKRLDTATPSIQTIVDQPRVLEDNDDGIQRLELAGGLEDLVTPAPPSIVHTPVETVEQPSTPPKMPSQETADYLIGREITILEQMGQEYEFDMDGLKKMMYDAEANSKVMAHYQEMMGPLRNLLDEHFDSYEDHLHTGYDKRDLNECREKDHFRERFLMAVQERKKAKQAPEKTVQQPVQVGTSLLPSYKRPSTDDELEMDFEKYLKNDTGKQMDPLSKVTVSEYKRRVFSPGAHNSLKEILRRMPQYGANFNICQLMFNVETTKHVLIPEILAQAVMPGEVSGLTVHSGIAAASALLKLIAYFKICASSEDLAEGDVKHMLLRTEYVNALDQLKDRVRPNIKKISNKSAALAKSHKKEVVQRNPEEAQMTKEAVDRYFKSTHMVEMLAKIKTMSKECKDQDFIPDNKQFMENSRWLMMMITYVNGARAQSCEIMKEKERLTSRRATQDDLKKVILDTQYLSKGDVQAIHIDGGKTGTVSLVVPPRLFKAMLETSMIKKHVRGEPEPGDLFFTDLQGKPILMETSYRSKIGLEVYKVMGISRLTATQARRITATRMVALELPPSQERGMGQLPKTQEDIYCENREEQGIQSKLAANAPIFEHEATLESDSDSEHEEALRKESQADVQLGKKYLQDKWQDLDWKNFTQDTSARTDHKKMLVEERFRLIWSIYSLVDPEYSCLFLAGDRVPSSNARMGKHLERFLYSPKRDMIKVRMDFAAIAASMDMFTDVDEFMFRKLAELIRESFRALNRKRLEGRAGTLKLHVIMNYTYLCPPRQSDTDAERSVIFKRPVLERGAKRKLDDSDIESLGPDSTASEASQILSSGRIRPLGRKKPSSPTSFIASSPSRILPAWEKSSDNELTDS
jgi:hypothetical protein